MTVTLSDVARADLRAIAAWIAQDNPARAESYIDELLDACDALAEFPNANPSFVHPSLRALRRKNHGRYAIIYEVGPTEITVVTIVHGARDFSALF